MTYHSRIMNEPSRTARSRRDPRGPHAPGLVRTQSLSRAVELLRAVAANPSGISGAALTRITGLPQPTVARALATLSDSGFVEVTDAGWALGYEFVRLARAADPYGPLLAAARPVMETLVRAASETVVLGVRRVPVGFETIYQIDAPNLVGVANWVGRPLPLHASGMGKHVLAELSEEDLTEWLEGESLERCTDRTIVDPDRLRTELARVRATDTSEVVDELEPGLSGLGRALRGPSGELAAVVAISGPSFRLPARKRKELAASLAEAATAIARRLGWSEARDADGLTGVHQTSRKNRSGAKR
jgi:DNA-binding IclR family transcriptional regulator